MEVLDIIIVGRKGILFYRFYHVKLVRCVIQQSVKCISLCGEEKKTSRLKVFKRFHILGIVNHVKKKTDTAIISHLYV